MSADRRTETDDKPWWKKSKFHTILKLVGAGVTGGYLALRVSRPRNSYEEFVEVYDTLSLDFSNQLKSTLLQSLIPSLPAEKDPEFEELLDQPATFLEMLRFFQRTLPQFDELIIKGLRRFYALREGGLLASAARRKMAGCAEDTFQVGLDELYNDLENSFATALAANSRNGNPQAELLQIKSNHLPDRLEAVQTQEAVLSAVIFDALSSFLDEVSTPGGTL